MASAGLPTMRHAIALLAAAILCGCAPTRTPLPATPPTAPKVEVTTSREGWPPRPVDRSEIRVVESTTVAGDLSDSLAREARATVERDPRARTALGARWAYVEVDPVEAEKGAQAPALATYRAWYFSHSYNTALEVRLRGSVVTEIRRDPSYSPPEGRAEVDSALALARTDPRLQGRVEGLRGQGIVTYPAKGQPGYGHRVLHVTFFRADEDLAPFAAIVDLTDRIVLRAVARGGR